VRVTAKIPNKAQSTPYFNIVVGTLGGRTFGLTHWNKWSLDPQSQISDSIYMGVIESVSACLAIKPFEWEQCLVDKI